jgi:acyl transferase domain-containing protein
VSDEGAEPIAIVGMSLRVPGADSVEAFWRNLVGGVVSRTVFDRAGQAARGVPERVLDDPAFVPVSCVLDGLEQFDPGLFGMTAQEADLADPQQRLFLEHAHAALLDAGCDPARYPGEVGVYAGTNTDLYQWLNIRRDPAAVAAAGELRIGLGNKPDYLASTVSYRLNLRGPSLAVHTACSSSLVAVHLAAEALRAGECDAALAGGVCVELPHRVGYVADEGYTSADGRCRPFDARADGTVYGSGVGVVVLKRLADARADGDTIRALVVGNAVNNDGATKVGFTAPSVGGQVEVVTQALSVAGVDPRSVGYVEAHGTGTVLGDSIEVTALSAAYGDGTDERGWCGIGSVKANIGHLSQAGGVVGLIKAVLALGHRVIPPTAGFERPHPEIDFAGSPYYVVATLTAWEPDGRGPRRAGVSSLGLGGTNAHVVLQEAPPPDPAPARPGTQLVQVSAATPAALAAACTRLAAHLTAHPGLDLRDVSHTLADGRPAYRHRAAVVATDLRSAAAALTDRKRRPTGDASAAPRVAFLFPGQGTQYGGMGARLYETEPVFAAAVDDCAAILRPILGEDLRELLFATGEAAEAALAGPGRMQPALFTVEYALAALWQSWGVRPAAMIGHSVGEYVAATVAGVFDLPGALRVVAARGRLVEAAPPGRMLAVQHGADEVAGWLPEGVWIAVVNGPGTCVVAGAPEPVEAVEQDLRERGVGCTLLRTPHAVHSPVLDPVRAEFAAVVASVPLRAPALTFWSNLTAEPVTADQAVDPHYWAGQLCGPVRFGASVAGLVAGDPAGWALLECGPGRQLAGLARMNLPAGAPAPLRSLPAATERLTDQQTCYEAAGRLWVAGVPVRRDLSADRPRRLPLPGYPYERTRHWIDPAPAAPEQERPRPAATGGPVIEVPVWHQLPDAPAGPPPAGCLVFAADDLGRALADRLRAAGTAVTVVAPGPAFAAGPDGYRIRPAESADCERLLAALGGPPRHVVHAWALAGEPAGRDVDAVRAAQRLGYFSLLTLVAALPATPVRIDVVTGGAEDVLGGDLVRPEHATVAGIARVVPLERRDVAVRWTDVDPAHRSTVDSLVVELCAPDRPAAVALRRGRRWHRAFETVDPPAGDPVRPGGRYLITGGLGRVGSAVAEELAAHRARLVLVSRTALPPRDEWPRLAGGNGHAGPVSRAVATVQRLERAGAEVRHVAADVTDVARLREVRAEVEAAYGGLDGIVHAARLPETGLVAATRPAEAAAELAPKVAGALALGAVFGDLPLDFAVLCSSVSALAGGLGRADDCAANAFLDALARGDHGWRTRPVAVGWGAWREAGLPDQDGLAPADGVAALRRVLAARLGPQVAVGAYPVAAVVEHEHEVAAALATGAGTTADVRAGADLGATVARIWGEVLGVDGVGPHDDFFGSGGTSLVAAQLVLRIRQAVGVRLSMRVLFDAPTVAAMVARIEQLRTAPAAPDAETPIPRLRRPGRRP